MNYQEESQHDVNEDRFLVVQGFHRMTVKVIDGQFEFEAKNIAGERDSTTYLDLSPESVKALIEWIESKNDTD